MKFFKRFKGALKSMTVQVNTAAAVVLYLLAEAGKLDFIADNPEYSAVIAGAIALINILLRFKTSKPLEER